MLGHEPGADAARAAAAGRVRRAGSSAASRLHRRGDAEARPPPQPDAGTTTRPVRGSSASGFPLDRKVGKLSGGQQAQVALTLALAKRPELLILDEPVASLDPLARREFMNTVMEAVSETSAHRRPLVAHRRRPRARLRPPRDPLPRAHAPRGADRRGPREPPPAHRPARRRGVVARVHDVIRESHTERQTSLLVRANGHVFDARWEVHEVDLEEIVLAYLGYGGSARACESGGVVIWLGLAPAAHGDADRGRHPRGRRRDPRSDRHRDGARVRPRRHRLLPRPHASGCGDAVRSFQNRFSPISVLLGWLTLLPGLFGVAARRAVHRPARER